MTPRRMAAIHEAAFAGGETWDETSIRALLDRPRTLSVTHPPDAFALVQALPPEAELLTIAVDPRAQGRGVGRDLLRAVFAAAAAAGCETLHLEVAADNAAARALYAAAGLAETGRRPRYYRRPDGTRADAVAMAVSLPAQHSGTDRGS
ncbi:GNAT family N-acetyltransferase [Roseibacterium sp. SDUM158017]|uniref:GNAT family N-acetyltransferase n=1 Tax=Roseicyclus salinarum TaxID=3036773 RepID=UPI0024156F0A|nr:GNAT family N-acetyltransferase [Roseibacterium sp. SDUM158017]MDG4647209.1 GNAT family N-acetyltransferase [Roseibacterium sp. SDUM158017]